MKLITILILLGVLALPASASEIISGGGNSKINATILEWSPQPVNYAYVNGTFDETIEYYITTAESMTEYTWSVDEKPVAGDVDGNTYFYVQTWDNDSIGFHKVNFKGNNSGARVEFQWYVNVYEIEGYRGGELFDVIDDTLENHYAQIKIRMFKDKIVKHGSNSSIAVQMVNQLYDEISKRQMTLEDLKSEFKAGNITIEEDVAALKHAQLEAKYNEKIAKEMAIISKEIIKDEESGKKSEKLLEIENNEDQERKESRTNVISNVIIQEDQKETSQEVKDKESGKILDELHEVENNEDQEKKESKTNVISNVIIQEDQKETSQDVKDEGSWDILNKLLEINNKLDQERKESRTNVRYNVIIQEDQKETSQDVKDKESGKKTEKESQTYGRSNVEYHGNTVEGNKNEGSGKKTEKESQTPAKSNATAVPTENATAVPTENATAVPTENATAVPTENATAVPTENATAVPTENATAVPTENATIVPTENATVVPTENATIVPTETTTVVPTETVTVVSTETSTVIPTETSTVIPTETATVIPTETATVIPTETTIVEPAVTEEGNKDAVSGNQAGSITIKGYVGVLIWAQPDVKYNSEFEMANISKEEINPEESGNNFDKLLINNKGEDKENKNQTQE